MENSGVKSHPDSIFGLIFHLILWFIKMHKFPRPSGCPEYSVETGIKYGSSYETTVRSGARQWPEIVYQLWGPNLVESGQALIFHNWFITWPSESQETSLEWKLPNLPEEIRGFAASTQPPYSLLQPWSRYQWFGIRGPPVCVPALPFPNCVTCGLKLPLSSTFVIWDHAADILGCFQSTVNGLHRHIFLLASQSPLRW